VSLVNASDILVDAIGIPLIFIYVEATLVGALLLVMSVVGMTNKGMIWCETFWEGNWVLGNDY
jgi:hypothetical protein